MPRPKKKLTSKDYPAIAAMAARGLKKADVARRLGMAVRTFDAVLERDERAREAYEAGLSELHEELVGGLVEKARNGNVSAAIFLLKAKFEYRENAPVQVEHEQRVADRGAPALVLQVALAVLERAGDLQRLDDPDEARTRVVRQSVGHVRVQSGAVEGLGVGAVTPAGNGDGGHPRAAFVTGDLHPEHGGVLDARRRGDDVRDLARGDVLALPAKRVSEAVDEAQMGESIEGDEVAGIEPGVVVFEEAS